jgi:hypothetical protein
MVQEYDNLAIVIIVHTKPMTKKHECRTGLFEGFLNSVDLLQISRKLL